MQSFRTGLAFCRQAWRTARRAPDCFRPSIFGILAGVVITLLALIPIGLVDTFLRKSIPGILLLGFLCTLLLCAQFAIGELSTLATAYLFHRHFVQTEGESQKLWGLLGRAGLDWLILVTVSPITTVQRWQRRRRVAGAKPEQAWLEATYLVMPLMVIEKLNLKDSLRRVAQLVNEHTLFGKDSIIGVSTINWLVYAGLGIIAAVIGLVVAWLLHGVTGACLAIVIFSLFSLAAIFMAGFTRATYHTCLYGGAHLNEAALKGKSSEEAWARKILAAAINPAVH
jgi:hypothetical protein